ncbi:hypothetical protein ABZP36_005542 [Zizania latifolia]
MPPSSRSLAPCWSTPQNSDQRQRLVFSSSGHWPARDWKQQCPCNGGDGGHPPRPRGILLLPPLPRLLGSHRRTPPARPTLPAEDLLGSPC